MAVQWFGKLAGLKFEQVPYRAAARRSNDLLGGMSNLDRSDRRPLIPHHKAGTLRLLAQTTATRSPSLPDVPTFEEAGVKGLVLEQWLGVFAPAGTPPAIISLLNSGIDKALADPAVRKLLADSARSRSRQLEHQPIRGRRRRQSCGTLVRN